MIQLSTFMWAMALLFGYIGFLRGFSKEMISTAGIILGLFALFQFNDTITQLLITMPAEQGFLLRAIGFGLVVFFAYHDRTGEIAQSKKSRGSREDNRRDELQTNILGAILGFTNGYLVWGSLWYFMHITNYPLSPYISAPIAGSYSANFIEYLPLFVLGGGPAGDGNLLAGLMIVLFLIVLIVI
jgi:hypothetical protein